MNISPISASQFSQSFPDTDLHTPISKDKNSRKYEQKYIFLILLDGQEMVNHEEQPRTKCQIRRETKNSVK